MCASRRTLTLFLEHRHRPARAERKVSNAIELDWPDWSCTLRCGHLCICPVRSFSCAESQAQCNPKTKSTTKPLCFKISHAHLISALHAQTSTNRPHPSGTLPLNLYHHVNMVLGSWSLTNAAVPRIILCTNRCPNPRIAQNLRGVVYRNFYAAVTQLGPCEDRLPRARRGSEPCSRCLAYRFHS